MIQRLGYELGTMKSPSSQESFLSIRVNQTFFILYLLWVPRKPKYIPLWPCQIFPLMSAIWKRLLSIRYSVEKVKKIKYRHSIIDKYWLVLRNQHQKCTFLIIFEGEKPILRIRGECGGVFITIFYIWTSGLAIWFGPSQTTLFNQCTNCQLFVHYCTADQYLGPAWPE